MPPSPSLTEFRRGGPGLVAATVGSAVGVTSLLFYSQGSLTVALQQEFGWTRAEVSSAYLFTTVALTVAAVPLGWLLDRHGPRRVALVSVPGLTLVLLVLSRFDGGLLHFHLLYGLAGLLGAGTTSVVYTKAINARFLVRRGLALGITLSGIGLGALLLPPLVTHVVQGHGWRSGFLALAVLSVVVMPFILVGLRPGAVAARVAPSTGMARSQAFRSRSFWTLLIGFVLVGLSVPAVIPHLVPMLTDSGVPPARASSISALIGIGVIVGRLSIGFLVDRFFAPFVAAPLFALTAAGCVLLGLGGPEMAPVAALLIGLSFGAEADLIAFLCGHCFGMRHYGVIYGAVYAVFGIAIALGPIWVGRIRDVAGDYTPALLVVAVLVVLGLLVLLTLPRYHEGRATAPGALGIPQHEPSMTR